MTTDGSSAATSSQPHGRTFSIDFQELSGLNPLLRPSFSSEEMFIVLNNADSILDLAQGHDGQEIYRVAEELSHLPTSAL